MDPDRDVQHALKIARLILRLGRVDRITMHPDGYPESDTDHSMMLALVAAELRPGRLRLDLILSYALVHDLIEAYCGDTPTLVALDDAGRAAKNERERLALMQLREELGSESWIVRTIFAYESQMDPEARWVKWLDKCMPKLTHCLNAGRAVRAQGLGLDDVRTRVAGQLQAVAESSPDLPEAFEFGTAAMAALERAWKEPETPDLPSSEAMLLAKLLVLASRLEQGMTPGGFEISREIMLILSAHDAVSKDAQDCIWLIRQTAPGQPLSLAVHGETS